MPRTRTASPDDQATQPHSSLPSGRDPGAPRSRMARLLTSAGLCVLVLLLGALAKADPVARLDLHADEHCGRPPRRAGLGFPTTYAKWGAQVADMVQQITTQLTR